MPFRTIQDCGLGVVFQQPVRPSLLQPFFWLSALKMRQSFWLTFAACLAIVCMQLVFWLVTQPVNRFWLKNHELSASGERSLESVKPNDLCGTQTMGTGSI